MKKELALKVFARDDYTCQYCCRAYAEDDHALQPHHIKFKSQGGKDVEDNLISMCWKCHRLLHDGFILKNVDEWLNKGELK